MADRLLKAKKKGNNGWMRSFMLAPRSSDAEQVEKARLARCAEQKARIVRSNWNR